MGTGRIRRMRRGWWALGALVAVVTVGALTAPDSDPGELADAPVNSPGRTPPEPTLASSTTPATTVRTPPADAARQPPADDPAAGTADTAVSPADTAVSPADTAVSPPDTVDSTVEAAPIAIAALSLLEGIPAKGRAPRTGYDRGLFGTAWTDDVTVELGHNGCDTRNDLLRRDLTRVVLKENSSGCAVLSGTLQDPYTGRELPFVRGSADAGAIQIDHVVSVPVTRLLPDVADHGVSGMPITAQPRRRPRLLSRL